MFRSPGIERIAQLATKPCGSLQTRFGSNLGATTPNMMG
jgi:hypothetical protein